MNLMIQSQIMSASDNENRQKTNLQQTTTNTTTNSGDKSINEKCTYSNMVKSTNQTYSFPKKDQAIILNVVEELKLSDYVIAVGKIIGPKNIIFASRISNNRICIYLKEVSLVDKLMSQHPIIEINNTHLSIRRLVTPAKRILISNVPPVIPHEMIIKVLHNYGLQLVSPVSFLKAGIQGEEYNHILSFRRQVFVTPPENEMYELPSTALINFDDTSYRVFLTFDEITCFICKKNGHVAKSCPNNETQTPNNEELLIHLHEDDLQTTTIDQTQLATRTHTSEHKKRPPPSSNLSEPDSENNTPTSATQIEMTDDIFTQPKPKSTPETGSQNKRLKKSTSMEANSIKELLEPARTYIQENSHNLVLNFDQLVSFMENSQNSQEIITEAYRYTSKIDLLVEMIYNIYPHLTTKSIKAKCTKINKILKKHLGKNNTETRSSVSMTSVESDMEVAQTLEHETN